MRVLLVVVAVLTSGCIDEAHRKLSTTPPTVDQRPPFLQIHMRDGQMFNLDTWTVHEQEKVIDGDGTRFSTGRKDLGRGHFTIKMSDVALYSTNTVESSPSVAGLAVVTGVSVAIGVACILNPKSCFGSCPTFYAPDAAGKYVLQAEGFSDAIAPSLATHDRDALWRTTAGGPFTLRVTNEAYETHVIQGADLIAIPHHDGERIVADGEHYFAARLTEPTTCTASEGDCLTAVRALDTHERTSLTDEHDLATREYIELTFPATAGSKGIVIGARQSLVTTFLLYQGLAYLGNTVVDWLTTDLHSVNGQGMRSVVGGITVQVFADNTWRDVDEIYETGPLATDVHFVALPDDGSRVRLQLPQGGWRIDYIAEASLDREVTPIRISPSKIRGVLGKEYSANRTPATAFPVITQPGDAYELTYDLPAGPNELYLDSHGYYLEWMRKEWLAEQNPLAAIRMLASPARAAKEFAPTFKKLEPQAETLFWKSRYAHP
ncbi:MAG: hypothetical protein QM831_09340 [Kofleriaceae bacterium]